MEYTKYYKDKATEALRGNWDIAVFIWLIAALFGANDNTTSLISTFTREFSDQSELLYAQQGAPVYFSILIAFFLIVSAYSTFTMFFGGVTKLGFVTLQIKLLDKQPVRISDLFSQFPRFWQGFLMHLLLDVYLTLWSLLFIIPGIIKSYSYAMTPYILAEHPELSPSEAIDASRRMMHGNKGNLFGIRFSFIGWRLLCAIPISVVYPCLLLFFGRGTAFLPTAFIPCLIATSIGNLVLGVYESVAIAAFYQDIKQ